MEAEMFQKNATFRGMGARRASGPVVLTYANDNRINAGAPVAPFRNRPVLVCHWRPTEGGKLECYWEIESAGRSAAEEPDGQQMMRPALRAINS
jgi:hypothetical protein